MSLVYDIMALKLWELLFFFHTIISNTVQLFTFNPVKDRLTLYTSVMDAGHPIPGLCNPILSLKCKTVTRKKGRNTGLYIRWKDE